jgi:hypothetical protein
VVGRFGIVESFYFFLSPRDSFFAVMRLEYRRSVYGTDVKKESK